MNNLSRTLRKVGVVEKGDFVLKSGARTDKYYNVKKAYGSPEALREISTGMWNKMKVKPSCLAVCGAGGIPPGAYIYLEYMIFP